MPEVQESLLEQAKEDREVMSTPKIKCANPKCDNARRASSMFDLCEECGKWGWCDRCGGLTFRKDVETNGGYCDYCFEYRKKKSSRVFDELRQFFNDVIRPLLPLYILAPLIAYLLFFNKGGG